MATRFIISISTSNIPRWKVIIDKNEWYGGEPVNNLLEPLKYTKNLATINNTVEYKISTVNEDGDFFEVIFNHNVIENHDIPFGRILDDIQAMFYNFMDNLVKIYRLQKAAKIYE